MTKVELLTAAIRGGSIAKAEVKNLYKNTTVTYTRIRDIGSAQHSTYIPGINDYINQLDTVFGNVYSVYAI